MHKCELLLGHIYSVVCIVFIYSSVSVMFEFYVLHSVYDVLYAELIVFVLADHMS